MKILLVHNLYQQPGGEDIVFEQERKLLERAGHTVSTYCRSNCEIDHLSALGKVSLLKSCVWATDVNREFGRVLISSKPDIVHVHNTFVMISPSIYYACRAEGVPVVQTLHNFRLLCPSAGFFRDGKVCEECVEHSLWRGICYGCYRNSRTATAAAALMLAHHRRLGTWDQLIDCYIALTEFSRKKFIAAGFRENQIVVKPNFADPDPGQRQHPGDYALFVGRLSAEKGLSTMIRAWEQLPRHYKLRIAGEGPEREALQAQAQGRGLTSVEFLGRLSREDTIAAIKGAKFLMLPSECYENFPMTIVESFACGTPVLCSEFGAPREIVKNTHTGIHFAPGDARDLAEKVDWAWNHPECIDKMGKEARREYEDKYTAPKNYNFLMQIYRSVLSRSAITRTQFDRLCRNEAEVSQAI